MATGYRIRLTAAQRDELHHRAREREVAPRLRDRLEMVRLSDLDWSVPRIAAYLGCHEQTARRAVKAFLAGGFEALPDQPRLAAWLAETQAVWIDAEHLAARLRARKFRWKRTKRSVQHKADPHLQEQARADLEVLTF